MTDQDFRCVVCGAMVTGDFLESEANKSGRSVAEVMAEFRLAGCLAVRMRHTGYTGGVQA